MRTIVTVVICAFVATPAGAAPIPDTGSLLRQAARLSGLPARRAVPTARLTAARYDALRKRAYDREYPRALRTLDRQLYALLGLTAPNMLVRQARTSESRAWYDPAAHKLFLGRTTTRAHVVHELGRALVDQNFGLARLTNLRRRDRDRAIAAKAIVDGAAALASRLRPRPLRGTPLERFLQLEHDAGLGPGRALAAELRYLGGRNALVSALRTFPQTTEQLLHVDKFLERERARSVPLPSHAGSFRLATSETFGELDVRSLLRAAGDSKAAATAAGWGGGRLAYYRAGEGEELAALVLRWDTPEDAREWRDAVSRYVAATFPGIAASDCPPLDRCWSSTAELAAGVFGERSVFVSGPGAAQLAAQLLN